MKTFTLIFMSLLSLVATRLNAQEGCLDPLACNYNELAFVNNGQCTYTEVWYIPYDVTIANQPAIFICGLPPEGYYQADKCTMDRLVELDSYCIDTSFDQICLDGYNSIIDVVNGCTDLEACNYSADALCDNGCCIYPILYLDDGSVPYYDCSPPNDYLYLEANECCLAAVNPNYMTTVWNFYEASEFRDDYLDCMSGDLKDGLGNPVQTRGCSSNELACNYAEFPCVEEECISDYTYLVYLQTEFPSISKVCFSEAEFDYDDYWIELENSRCAEKVIEEFAFGDFAYWFDDEQEAYQNCLCSSGGCTDVLACNYDPSVNVDDGSCRYPGCNLPDAMNYDSTAGCFDGNCIYGGCTYSGAPNYDPLADVDDGSCIINADGTCLGDLDGNDVVTAGDLTIFLTVFGTSCLE